MKESPERLKISHYRWDHLRLKRIENRQELNYVNKPSVYKNYKYTLIQQNRAKIIEYLQNHGKFNLKE